ncbi:MAG: transposase [Actinomycetia bacterium]|nr:transposase [Actinomycetes bacterium]
MSRLLTASLPSLSVSPCVPAAGRTFRSSLFATRTPCCADRSADLRSPTTTGPCSERSPQPFPRRYDRDGSSHPRLCCAGTVAGSPGEWTTQAARNLFISHADQLEDARALARDRGSQFIDALDEVLRSEGLKILKTPARVPVANTFTERWIGSIRRELLKQPKGLPRTIIWNRKQLQRLVRGYIDHHNTHRPHQSLDQRPPTPASAPPKTPPATITVLRNSRCGGLIHEHKDAV